jgi:hypothetical protein
MITTITKSQLKKLDKIRLKSQDKSNEYLKEVYENENFYTACDGYKMVTLFKYADNKNFSENIDNEQYQKMFNHTLANSYSNITDYVQVKVNRDDLLEMLKEIRAEIKDNTSIPKEMKLLPIVMSVDPVEQEMSLSSKLLKSNGKSIELKYKAEKSINIDIINPNRIDKNTHLRHAFNINYMIDMLDIINKDESITLYFNQVNVYPSLIESSNVLGLILPIKLAEYYDN